MKRVVFFLCLTLFASAFLPAQEDAAPEDASREGTPPEDTSEEGASLDWDIDSVFDAPFEEDSPSIEENTESNTTGVAVQNLLKRNGITFSASSEFATGILPGWREAPWVSADDHGYYLDRVIRMRNTLSLDAQISEVFRVKSTVYFQIPDFKFSLGDFFFDYSVYNAVFFRGGKYNLSWGVSPNYGFTNLLSRVPKDGYSGDSFIFKAEVPAGIGGVQVLAMTRADLMNNAFPELRDFGFGGKYNLALRGADFDAGVFYQEGMALRAFLSAKTTLWNTELYTEGLFAIDVDEPSNVSGAGNFGFARDFFGGKFNVNGEVFYNAEKDVYWYHGETSIRDAGKSPFIEGLNGALNLLYRFDGKTAPRLFLQTRYAPFENSLQLVPGFRFSPWPHIDMYLAAPMALGSRDGYYYKHTVRVDRQNRALPFSVMLLLTLKGTYQFGHYF